MITYDIWRAKDNHKIISRYPRLAALTLLGNFGVSNENAEDLLDRASKPDAKIITAYGFTVMAHDQP